MQPQRPSQQGGVAFYQIALTCMFCQALGTGLIGMYGFFVNPISDQFNISKAVVGLGPAMLFMCTACFSPVVGYLVDRVSIKKIMLCGVMLAGLSLISMSQMTTLFSVGFCFALFCCSFILYGPVVCNSLLTKSYQQHLPRALGISAMGVSIAGVVIPPIIAFLMTGGGWQYAVLVIGLVIIMILTILIQVSIQSPLERKSHQSISIDHDLVSPYRQKSFWLIGVSFSMLLSISIVNSFSLIAHFQQLGYKTSQAAILYSLAGMSGFCGKLMFSILSDTLRLHLKVVLTVTILLGVIGYILLAFTAHIFLLGVGSCLIGLCIGTCLPMQPFLNSIYFGNNIAGSVNGQQAPLFLPFGIVSGPVSGWLFDNTGSYVYGFMIAGGVTLLALLLLTILLNRPMQVH